MFCFISLKKQISKLHQSRKNTAKKDDSLAGAHNLSSTYGMILNLFFILCSQITVSYGLQLIQDQKRKKNGMEISTARITAEYIQLPETFFFLKIYAMAILAMNKVVSTSTRPLEIFDAGNKYTVVGSTFNSNCLYSVKEWNSS